MNFNHYTFRLTSLCAGLLLLSGCAVFSPTPDYVDPTSGMQFVHVPGGPFQMGAADGVKDRELPVHTVTIEAFSVGMYEVTFDQYDRFCKATSRNRPDDFDWGRENRPVINVSWVDAIEYAEWLSKETGLDFNLPSESEWEYFARAGTTTPFWNGETLPKGSANCRNCGSEWDSKQSAPVGSFRPNPWGIYDTAGNVLEWTLDSYLDSYNGAPTDNRAWLDGTNENKVIRGGSWEDMKPFVKTSSRDWAKKDYKSGNIGFRLVVKGLAPVAEKKK